MRLFAKIVFATVIGATTLSGIFAQDDHDSAGAPDVALRTPSEKTHKKREYRLTSDDRLSLLAAALDEHVEREAEPDCSHLVHEIYEAAGFPYDYAPSSDLYAGVENFQRVKSPLPGDLIVWRGHVGMVIKPSRHIFFSYLSSGPGTDDYLTSYWKHRGQPRFYRYIKKEVGRSRN